MDTIWLATTNNRKLEEWQCCLPKAEIFTLEDLENFPKVREGTTSYDENALVKARALAQYLNKPAFGDDAGVEIEAMPGELGVETARWFGKESYLEKRLRVLERLKGLDDSQRRAKYVVSVAYCEPDGKSLVVRKEVSGRISQVQCGKFEFAFDSIFIQDGSKRTLASYCPRTKVKTNARGAAIRELREEIENGFER